MIVERDQPRLTTALCLALAAITLAVFGQTIHHQFIDLDDGDYLQRNLIVTQGLTPNGIVWAFTHFHSNNWHPLTWLSHQLDCQLWGLHPGGHHLTNVLLHAATVIALFLVLRRLTGALWRSAFVAAVFAIHPLRVESVAWIAERKDVLSGLFFMLTIAAYIRYVRSTDKLKSGFGLVFLLFACGLMCKPMLVTLPLVLLLLDYWPLNRWQVREGRAPASPIKNEALGVPPLGGQGLTEMVAEPYPEVGRGSRRAGDDLQATTAPQERRPTEEVATPDIAVGRGSRRAGIPWPLFLEKLPLFALSAASCVVTIFAQRRGMFSIASFPLPYRLANAALSCVIYLRQMLWPVRLAVFYPFPHVMPWSRVVAAVLLLAGASSVAWRYRRTQPWLLVGWLWYLIMLLPVLGILQVGEQSHADRYTYLPQIGIYLALTWLVSEFFSSSPNPNLNLNPNPPLRATLAAVPALAIIAALMFSAWNQTAFWKDTETLANHALACTVDNHVAHTMLGNAYVAQGKTDSAIACFREALRIQPGFAEARNNLGTSLVRQGKLDEAIVCFKEVLANRPNYADAHYNLASALGKEGKEEEGISEFQQALRIDPGSSAAHNNLGIIFCKQGRWDEGIAQFRLVLKNDPSFFDAYNNLGNALMEQHKIDEAILCYRRALAINPSYQPAKINLQRAILQKN